MSNIIWVGPRESDIAECKNLFSGCISFFGSHSHDQHYSNTEAGIRINHNDDRDNRLGIYNRECMGEALRRDPDSRFMFYNPIHVGELNPELRSRVICHNDSSLLSMLDDKSETRLEASRIIPTVPYTSVQRGPGSPSSLPQGDSASVVQVTRSSGGFGTYVVRDGEADSFFGAHPEITSYIVSPYFDSAPSINIHFFLDAGQVFALPGSVQLVRDVKGKLLYLGADFDSYGEIDKDGTDRAKRYGTTFLERYAADRYRGVLGIDFLIVDGEPLFLEVNPRFQASTPLLNKSLLRAGLPTVQEMQMGLFAGKDYSSCLETASSVEAHGSFVTYIPETWNRPDIEPRQLEGRDGIDRVSLDGYRQGQEAEPEAYLFKVSFSRRISRLGEGHTIKLHENLLEQADDFSAQIEGGNPRFAKISLINQGVRVSPGVYEELRDQGGIREGVFCSIDLTTYDGLRINSPYGVGLSCLSPWLIAEGCSGLELRYRGRTVSSVSIDPPDSLAARVTSRGVPLGTYCFLATDRVRVHHGRSCYFKRHRMGCAFCNVPPDLSPFQIEDVFEAVDTYMDQAKFRHYLIGGGSGIPGSELEDVLRIARHIRERDKRPLYLMCLPPRDLTLLDRCKEAGIDEVAFNIEVFDRDIARSLMPGKGAIPLSQYLAALERAVDLWGGTGNVRSLLIAGLEPMDSMLQGVEVLSSMGVAPVLSAFRPLPDTLLAEAIPPSNAWLMEAYERSAAICASHGLALGPDCPACQNNVLAFPPDLV